MKASSGPSTAPREWTIYRCVCGLDWMGGNSKYCPAGHSYKFTTAKVVERASLDRVVEERDELKKALEEAANDLGKAANQFASMRESQRAGYSPSIQSNPEKFEQKEARARAALRSGEGERHE